MCAIVHLYWSPISHGGANRISLLIFYSNRIHCRMHYLDFSTGTFQVIGYFANTDGKNVDSMEFLCSFLNPFHLGTL